MKVSRCRRVLAALALLTPGLLPPAQAQDARLANLSTRAQVGTGSAVLTAGFVIDGTGNKNVLIRAVGPTLGVAPFNMTGVLANPTLTVFGPNSSTLVAAQNDNWPVTVESTFASVSAFPLTTVLDSAVVVSLSPGRYTAQVSGVGNTTGLALVEVYEVGTSNSKLINLSSRAQVATGANVMIPGIVVTSGTRRLLVRAAGPALTPLGVAGALGDPTITLVNASNATVASNNDWGTPSGPNPASLASVQAAITQSGAFAFAANSRDSALIAELPSGNYTIQVSGVGNTSGVALVEVYDISPVTIANVSLAVTRNTSSETGGNAARFTFSRDGDTSSALTVNYGVTGSATNGLDYPPLLGTITIPAGATSTELVLQPYADTSPESTETVILTLTEGQYYTIGSSATASASIADSPATLYVASLRPGTGAASSAASGLATIVLSADGSIATVNVSFSNLSSGQTGAHLFIGNGTNDGEYVLNLPLGQVNGTQWTIGPTGTYTSEQIVNALRNGQIFVGLDTAQYPAGELRGAFATALGSQTFTAPPAPPPVSLTNLSTTDAARLLTQSTFGPTKAEIDALTGGSVDAWITAQMALPATMPTTVHRNATAAEKAAAVAAGELADPNNYPLSYRQRAWFHVTLNAPDQLRQRVAFALSQILVVSDATANDSQTEPLAHYYDMLANNAFGNFRTLLEQVTLHPVMGLYLSHLRNSRATATTNPDENYAREVMQLFTIGLVQLQPDGTLKLSADGLPIPTYDQTVITEMAKVFTGWGFFSTRTNPSFRGEPSNYFAPMMLYPAFHEPAEKRLFDGIVIPANLGGTEDLRRTLDALFNHPNTAPFISRQLIQRLVTDNPSPAYVYRVAQKFANNGSGVRGDLAAVVRAILTDYEARSSVVADDPGYGKLKEPLLRYTAILRGFGASTSSGRNLQDNVSSSLAQAALRAPSVFNFFEPNYVYPGPLAAAGLVAPEFQITNDTTAISVPNLFRTAIFATATGANAARTYVLNVSAEQAAAGDANALIDRVSLILGCGQLSSATRARIATTINAIPSTAPQERAQTAILLVATSPEGATQR